METYYQKNKEKIKAQSRQWKIDNAEKAKETRRKHYKENKESIDKKSREWAAANRDKMNKSQREWKKRNRDKVLAQRERDKLDPFKVMKRRLRNRTNKAFKRSRWDKQSKNSELLGCTWEEAFSHIESLFTEGMNWDNRSEWHIDHKKPLDLATNEEELRELCHYTNLQPLWAEDNLKKSNKY